MGKNLRGKKPIIHIQKTFMPFKNSKNFSNLIQYFKVQKSFTTYKWGIFVKKSYSLLYKKKYILKMNFCYDLKLLSFLKTKCEIYTTFAHFQKFIFTQK